MQQRLLIVDDRYSDDEVIALVGACDYLVAMRLHAFIFATIAGTPFGAIDCDDKVRDYMSMLGREDQLLSWRRSAIPNACEADEPCSPPIGHGPRPRAGDPDGRRRPIRPQPRRAPGPGRDACANGIPPRAPWTADGP